MSFSKLPIGSIHIQAISSFRLFDFGKGEPSLLLPAELPELKEALESSILTLVTGIGIDKRLEPHEIDITTPNDTNDETAQQFESCFIEGEMGGELFVDDMVFSHINFGRSYGASRKK